MASKIKVDQLETVDGTGNITVNQPLSGSGAGLTSLPAANLTGSLPAISGASLTGILPAVGTSGNVLTSTGSAWASSAVATAGFTLGTEQATTSGTTKDFTGIPAGTKMIVVMIEGVSSSTAGWEGFVRIGDAGGIESSGYVGLHQTIDAYPRPSSIYEATAGSGIRLHDTSITDAGDALHGHVVLSLKDAANYTWTATGVLAQSTQQMTLVAVNKSLSAELTQVQVTCPQTFDAGSVNIMYQ